MIHEIDSLDRYLSAYGSLLGAKARTAMAPLHVPSRDKPVLSPMLRTPFEAQAHLIAAGVKTLRRQKLYGIAAECGVGKTMCGMGVVHSHAGNFRYRALVMCPPHLCGKWAREIRETLPAASVRIIESYRDLIELRSRPKPTQPEWWVSSQNKAKLGNPWRPAYATKLEAVRECEGPRIYSKQRQLRQGGLAFCSACGELLVKENKGEKTLEPIPLEDLAKRRHECFHCKSPAWTYTNEYDRWPVASYIHKHLKDVFRYLIADESHELKGADTAQANALGELAAAVRYVIPMTGTLIGGYAEHLRTLMFRMAPVSLVEDGFNWSNHMPFNEAYGRIETKIVEKESLGSDNRNSRGSQRTKTKYVRPGVMPTLFGRHLAQNFAFLSLDEVAENLPELAEEVIGVPMDCETAIEYERVEKELLDAIKDMVRKGDKRLLGPMLQTLLCYPDQPYGWGEIGYYDTEDDGSRHWVSVVTPDNLDPTTIRPKEQALVDACLARKKAGRQTWVFTTMTDKRDVCTRLKALLEAKGLRVEILRAKVKTLDREDWISKHGPKNDVIISHPQLVQTGLDLFDKGGGHNFATLIFYLTGYNLFTLRQAARRAWRVGQTERCEVLYFYYEDSMQARAMELMGRKLAAAEAIEGKFSSEGLAAMAGEESSAEMALARSLINNLDSDKESIRAWNRVVQHGSRMAGAQALAMEAAVVQNELPATAPQRLIIRQRGPRPRRPIVIIQQTQRPLFAEVH